MALIKCPECLAEISQYAKSCPHCGFPIADNYSETPKKGTQIEENKNHTCDSGKDTQESLDKIDNDESEETLTHSVSVKTLATVAIILSATVVLSPFGFIVGITAIIKAISIKKNNCISKVTNIKGFVLSLITVILSVILLLSASISVFLWCKNYKQQDNEKASDAIESIELSEKEVHIEIGEEYEITADVLPKGTDQEDIIWTTTNDSVIKLKDGNIKGLENGVAIIYAKTKDGIQSEDCWVYVNTPTALDELNDEEKEIYRTLTDEAVIYKYFKEPSSVTIRAVEKIECTDENDEITTMAYEYYMQISGENGFGGKSTDEYLVTRENIYSFIDVFDSYKKSWEEHGFKDIHLQAIDNLDLTRLNRALKEYFEEKGW